MGNGRTILVGGAAQRQHKGSASSSLSLWGCMFGGVENWAWLVKEYVELDLPPVVQWYPQRI